MHRMIGIHPGRPRTLRSLLLAGCLAALPSVPVWAKSHTADLADQPDDWFRSAEGLRITRNILSWQSAQGSWPKNLDTSAKPFHGDPKSLKGTFDNGATTTELRFLARAARAGGDARCQSAVARSIDHILKAQYPSGGWPQYYPPSRQYHRHITFNDDAMVRVMRLLRDVAQAPDFAFVDLGRRKAAQASFDLGIQCILKCQITVQGKLTVWCAQHDELDYTPRGGRKYELPSLSGAESVGILQLLMSLDHPTPEVIRSVRAGIEWFQSAKQTGIRIQQHNGQRTLVHDPTAPPLWARFYDLENGRPIFSDRDGVKKYDYMQIGRERRNGYAWYSDRAACLEQAYAAWQQKWAKPTAQAPR
jgi:pectate lyase